MNERAQRWLNGIAIGLSACVGLTVLGIVLLARSSPQSAPRANPPTPTEATLVATPFPATSEPTDIPAPLPTETPPTIWSVIVPGHTIGDPTTLREGPSLDWPVVASVPANTPLSIVGRWEGYDWYMVLWPDAPSGTAWGYIDLIQIDGDASQIPTVEPPP